jgi:Concanavalin A-like lectin/glucanases superfamily
MINAFRSLFKRHKLSHIASAIRAKGFDPFKELFGNGEQGVYYDPSDIITMFLDSAGTTPVAPVGTVADQPVGRILDKSGRGIHATQPTSTARPLLSARVNLLTKTEDFADVTWQSIVFGAGTAVKTPNYALAPDGTMTACRVVATAPTTAATGGVLRQSGLLTGVYTRSVWIKSNTGLPQVITLLPGANGGSKTVTVDWAEYSYVSASVAQYRTDIGVYRSGSATDTDATCDISIWHPQFELGSTATPYQRVNTASDYNAVGFPHFLKFDGVDDFLSTGSVDFTSTDKMSVFAGVRKLSDANGYAIIAELGVTTPPGSIGIFAPYAPGTGSYAFNSAGTVGQSAIVGTGYSAPVSNVLTCVGDISGDVATLRINGTQAATTSANQGTGNFGNYPLYIGRRGGTSLPFNGHIYGLIVRGAQSTEAEITSTEKFVAGKTGVVLP